MIYLKKIIDFFFYSNIYIALCSVAMMWQTYHLLGHNIPFNPLTALVFSCTLLIYAIHRLIGIKKVTDTLGGERFRVIKNYKNHIIVYAFLGILAGVVSFFMVSLSVQIALVVPGIISLAYVLPILGGKKKLRLRDVHLVKIFLVAVVWAYVTVFLPALELGLVNDPRIWLMLPERMLFIFAITLPFDIRDLKVDEHNEVHTIPGLLGIKNTLRLVLGCLLIFTLLCLVNYPLPHAIALTISAISTYLFIHFSPVQQHDYYFTGLIDGTMIVQFLLVLMF